MQLTTCSGLTSARSARVLLMKRLLSMTALSAAAIIGPVVAPGAIAFAQTVGRQYSLDIGPMSVEEGLKRIQQETGVRIVFSPDQLRERMTPGLSGQFTPEDAIKALLRGTGMELRNDKGLYVVVGLRTNAGLDRPLLKVAASPNEQVPVASASASAPATEAAAVEEIVVTGSRVIRDGYTAPTPVTVINEEIIQASAPRDLADFVAQLPSVIGSTTPRATASNASAAVGGINAISMRGLGASRTLVLLDGQRAVSSTANGLVDVSSFPQALVSRVDVVTGGASAAYGSDAVGGVVNFILNKTYTGIKGEVSGGVSTVGDDRNWKVVLTGGAAFADGRGQFLISGQIDGTDGIPHASQRAWGAATGVNAVTNPQYTATNGQPQYLVLREVGPSQVIAGGIITNTALKGIAFGPGGAPYMFNYGSIVSGLFMQGGSWQQCPSCGTLTMDPPVHRQNVFTRVSYDLAENIQAFIQLSWANDDATNSILPAWYGGTLTVRASNPFLPASVAARATALGVTQFNMGALMVDANQYVPYERQGVTGVMRRFVNRYVAGLNGKFDAFDTTWTWDTYYQVGTTHTSERTVNVPNTARLPLALDAVTDPRTGAIVCRSTLTNPTDGCVPYNPFGLNVNSAAVFNYLNGTPLRNQRYQQDVASVSLTGEPFSSWAGPVSVATGVEWRKEQIRGAVDPVALAGFWFTSNYKPNIGKYTVTEGFVETVVPIAKDTVWANQLELDLAARFTGYSTFGSVVTWKVGGTYVATDELRFRGSVSKDIRAPNLGELFSGGTSSAGAQLADPFNNGSTAAPTTLLLNVGNPSLRPEKGISTGFGGVVQPAFFPGFSASVDYWNIHMTDVVGALAAQDIINGCYSGNQSLCTLVDRSNGAVKVFVASVNVATQTNRGIDFETSYRAQLQDIVESWGGSLNLRILATRYLKNSTTTAVSSIDYVGAHGGGTSVTGGAALYQPKWTYTASASYRNDPISVTVSAHGFSKGVFNTNYVECTSGCPASTTSRPTINFNQAPAATYYDLAFEYKFGDTSAVEKTAFLAIQNVTNLQSPPINTGLGTNILFPQGPQLNPALYDSVGRMFQAGVRFKM